MLGELVYEGTGKPMGMRVLDDNGTLELTFQEQGAVFGTQCTNALTYVSTARPDGTSYSEGHEVMLTVMVTLLHFPRLVSVFQKRLLQRAVFEERVSSERGRRSLHA